MMGQIIRAFLILIDTVKASVAKFANLDSISNI